MDLTFQTSLAGFANSIHVVTLVPSSPAVRMNLQGQLAYNDPLATNKRPFFDTAIPTSDFIRYYMDIHVYVHIQMYTYTSHTCTNVHVYVYIQMYMYTCTYKSVHVHVYVHMQMYTYTRTYMSKFTCTMYMHICTYIFNVNLG